MRSLNSGVRSLWCASASGVTRMIDDRWSEWLSPSVRLLSPSLFSAPLTHSCHLKYGVNILISAEKGEFFLRSLELEENEGAIITVGFSMPRHFKLEGVQVIIIGVLDVLTIESLLAKLSSLHKCSRCDEQLELLCTGSCNNVNRLWNDLFFVWTRQLPQHKVRVRATGYILKV